MKTVEVPFIFNAKLKKDLMDNERICPVCHGTGLEIVDNEYGIKGDNSTVRFPYKHQSLSSCRNCYNGVVKVCEFCGKEINRYHYDCSCNAYVASGRAKRKQQETERIQKLFEDAYPLSLGKAARELEYVHVEETEEYICADDSDLIREKLAEGYHVFATEPVEMQLDAFSICESACDELHEGAMDNLDTDSLQEILDKWIQEEAKGTLTFYPNYDIAIVEEGGDDNQ